MAETISVTVWPHQFDNAARGTHILHALFGTHFQFLLQDAPYEPTLMPTHTRIRGSGVARTTMNLIPDSGSVAALNNFALEA